jgi:membrane-associated phospholipid phosphatase
VRPGEVAAVLGGSALLAGSWLVVAIQRRVPGWEAWLFERVNDLPDVLWPVLWGPMQLGSLAGGLAVVALTQIVGRDGRLTAAALVACLAAWWAAKGVKTLASRARPGALLANVHLREHAGGLGYVSGHSAVAFALAAVLGPSLPRRWQPVVASIATIVAAARVYAGAHLPLDVIGGAGLGLLLGTLSRWAFGLGGEGLPPADGRPR